jgi:hypothetical protein
MIEYTTRLRKNGEFCKKPGKKPDPNRPPKRPPTFTKGVKRPHVWITGTDPKTHGMLIPYLRHKAQARYRAELFDLTFDEYKELWWELWEQRGRRSEDLCMTRIDPEGVWTKDNCEIITRREHCQRGKSGNLGGRGRKGRNPHRSRP